MILLFLFASLYEPLKHKLALDICEYLILRAQALHFSKDCILEYFLLAWESDNVHDPVCWKYVMRCLEMGSFLIKRTRRGSFRTFIF